MQSSQSDDFYGHINGHDSKTRLANRDTYLMGRPPILSMSVQNFKIYVVNKTKHGLRRTNTRPMRIGRWLPVPVASVSCTTQAPTYSALVQHDQLQVVPAGFLFVLVLSTTAGFYTDLELEFFYSSTLNNTIEQLELFQSKWHLRTFVRNGCL
jgi:hypothetical protein